MQQQGEWGSFGSQFGSGIQNSEFGTSGGGPSGGYRDQTNSAGNATQAVVEGSGRLWVGNLDYDVRQADLQSMFDPYGMLKSVDVMMEREDLTKSRGYAFVEYEDREDALKAQEELNGTNFFGRALQINVSTPKGQNFEYNQKPKHDGHQNKQNNFNNYNQNENNGARLFVGNLDFGVRKDHLMPIFEKFGHVESCIVIMDRDNPTKSRGFGFVQYTFQADAEQAAEEVDGMMLRGRTVRVNLAAPKGSAELEQNKKNYKSRFQQAKDKISRRIYVGNLDYKVRETDLEPLFVKFGELKKVQVMFEQENPDKSRGYGFVEFEKPTDAVQAAHEMNDYVLMGRNMRVNMATYRQGARMNEEGEEEEMIGPEEDGVSFAGPYQGAGEDNFRRKRKRKDFGEGDFYNNKDKRQKQNEAREETEEDLFGDDNSSAAYGSYMLTKYVLQSFRLQTSDMGLKRE